MTTSLTTALVAAALLGAAPLPDTPKKPVVDLYQGVEVADPYRWLEPWNDDVRRWSDAENARAREFLDGSPDAPAIRARVAQLVKSSSVRYADVVERGPLFALKIDPAVQQPYLVSFRLADAASERTLVDPNAIDRGGAVAIDFFSPSLDGRRVAVSLSRNGSEEGDLHVYDTATGREVDEVLPHVNNGTAGGSVAWTRDGSGYWYTRYPRGEERPPEDRGFYQQVWYHRVGTPSATDRRELGDELPKIAEVELQTKRDGRYVLAQVKNGDGGEVAFWVRSTRAGARWTRVSAFEDRVVGARFGEDAALYLLSRRGAPRGRILRLPLSNPSLGRAKVVVREGEGTIEDYEPARRRLYVAEIRGGPSRLRAYTLSGRALPDVPILETSTVGRLVHLEDALLFENESYVVPSAWYVFDGRRRVVRTRLFQTSIADFADAEVVREAATSKDGTKVPLSILRRKGTKLDGTVPTLLYGYGGYGVSETPRFSALRRLWLDQGGAWALANLRGGGEYGDDWHYDGNLTKKQNVFDDFDACARLLVERGYATPARLAIMGGSNGGLLMGAALTQHPEQYRAVVSIVGIYDMLRVETSPNGVFNVTEFGTVKDPAQFKALYAYSPYHHVVDGVRYPSVLLMTGQNDPRVEPWHSRKFAARLQAATASQNPILLRTSAKTGHGMGSALDEVIAQRADMFTFLLHELGVSYRGPEAKGAAPAP